MPYTHHSHSGQFCHHASGILEDVVKEAIKKQFHTIGLTEHMPRFSEAELYHEEIEVCYSQLLTHVPCFVAHHLHRQDALLNH
jgi:histidinol-phosphatase (PHP family)